MNNRLIILSGVLLLLITTTAGAAVSVTAQEGTKLRLDAAKFARITDSAIRRAAPKTELDVSIVVSPPEVWMSAHPIRAGVPLPPEALLMPGPSPRAVRGSVFELVRLRYTIRDAKGRMIESVPLVFDVGHASTLEAQLGAMHRTADVIAARVADLSRS